MIVNWGLIVQRWPWLVFVPGPFEEFATFKTIMRRAGIEQTAWPRNRTVLHKLAEAGWIDRQDGGLVWFWRRTMKP